MKSSSEMLGSLSSPDSRSVSWMPLNAVPMREGCRNVEDHGPDLPRPLPDVLVEPPVSLAQVRQVERALHRVALQFTTARQRLAALALRGGPRVTDTRDVPQHLGARLEVQVDELPPSGRPLGVQREIRHLTDQFIQSERAGHVLTD